MITIYHNPKCSKSREGLCLLQNKNIDFKVVNYINTPFTFIELKNLIKLLKIKPIDLIRTKESIWKENFKNKTFSDDELIQLMLDNPKLIERPIVVNGTKAVIARPTEKIDEII